MKRGNENIDFLSNLTREIEKLGNIVKGRYMYDGECPFPTEFVEKTVYESGICAIYDHETLGLIAIKATMYGPLDIYGKPTMYNLITRNGRHITRVEADDPKLFIVMDNYQRIPLSKIAFYYAKKLSAVRNTIDSNTKVHMKPWLLVTNKDKLLQTKLLLRSYEEDAILTDDKSVEVGDAFKVLNLDVPYILDKLETQYSVIMNKFLKECGFMTIELEKNERLTEREAEYGKDVTIANDIYSYKYRKNMVEFLKEKYGVELEIKKTNVAIYYKESNRIEAEISANPEEHKEIDIKDDNLEVKGDNNERLSIL